MRRRHPTQEHFPTDYFRRYDESSDHNFYHVPRKVVHIDDAAITTLSNHYADVLPVNAIILDMMSSWRSHLPKLLYPERVVGLGMNLEEMAENPQLDEYIVHDLNQAPTLPYPDNVYDAVTCAVSIQYLTDPIYVFSEVFRVLKPGGIFVVSFSNRCFPTKAIAIWLQMSDTEHIDLVKQYFEKSADWVKLQAEALNTSKTGKNDPLYIVEAKKPHPDMLLT